MSNPFSRQNLTRSAALPAAPLPRPLSQRGPAPPVFPVDPDRNCPRCQTVLTDPHGIGLCPRCGFCRSLQVEGAAVLAAARKRQYRGAVNLSGLWQAIRVAPAALLIVCAASLAVVPGAYFASQRFAPGSRERAIWSACYLLTGSFFILAGSTGAVVVLRQLKEAVAWSDLFRPLHLWGLALRRLPATGWPVGIGSSGAFAVLAAVVWVGGLTYWLNSDPRVAAAEEPASPQLVAGRVKQSQRELERMRATDKQVARPKRPAAPESAPTAPSSPVEASPEGLIIAPAATRPASLTQAPTVDKRPTETCVIIGYVPKSAGQAPGLVLGTVREGRVSYVGVVYRGVENGSNRDLFSRVATLSRANPPIQDPKVKAIWVNPELFCEVHQSGKDGAGELIDPQLKASIQD